MKTNLVVLFVLVCLQSLSIAADKKPGSDAVVVEVLNSPLPHEESKRWNFLWDTFANKPAETQFSSYSTGKWKDNYAVFSGVLVKKAGRQKLDSVSLRKALDLVLKDSKDKIAYLPVGAYQTTLDGGLIWIITVKWELPDMGDNPKLGHIRMFAFDQKTLKQVAFCTCT